MNLDESIDSAQEGFADQDWVEQAACRHSTVVEHDEVLRGGASSNKRMTETEPPDPDPSSAPSQADFPDAGRQQGLVARHHPHHALARGQ